MKFKVFKQSIIKYFQATIIVIVVNVVKISKLEELSHPIWPDLSPTLPLIISNNRSCCFLAYALLCWRHILFYFYFAQYLDRCNRPRLDSWAIFWLEFRMYSYNLELSLDLFSLFANRCLQITTVHSNFHWHLLLPNYHQNKEPLFS